MDGTPAQYFYIFQGLTATTEGLNDSMACGWSNGATIRADVLDAIQPEVFASAQQLNDAINECYNDKLLEKATIRR